MIKRRTDQRRERVLAAIQTPKTVKDVQHECGITYINAYYTLQSLIEDKLAHITEWTYGSWHKPMAVYIAGEGRNAVLGFDAESAREEMVSVDSAIREAIRSWVASNTGDEDDQEQQGEA